MDSKEPSDSSNQNLTLFLSKNVYKTEIDKVEPKLWRFTLGTPCIFKLYLDDKNLRAADIRTVSIYSKSSPLHCLSGVSYFHKTYNIN